MSKVYRITLEPKEMPTHWYNIVADMKNKPLPPLHPGDKTTGWPWRFGSTISHGAYYAGSIAGKMD